MLLALFTFILQTNRDISRTIFINNISRRTAENHIKRFFTQFGFIHEAAIASPVELKGFGQIGYVTFQSTDAIDAVMERQDENGIAKYVIDGRVVECEAATVFEVTTKHPRCT